MHFESELLPGLWHVGLRLFQDPRGSFVKTYAQSIYREHGVDADWQEEFYSVSRKHVLRGMHFQVPPADHAKLVYCAHGSVLDVMLDLRKGLGYGRVAHVRLDSAEPSVLVMPSGIAHGFLSLMDDSLMVYKTSAEHNPACDAGIRWDSFGFDWRVTHPVVSDRDAGHPAFADYGSPF
ncbi:MAG: dTDP-4-dehydrorhamnose 3,5-epimerase family protein [Fluviibacter sp.]